MPGVRSCGRMGFHPICAKRCHTTARSRSTGKVNTLARNVWHRQGGDYRHRRNTKAEAEDGSMRGRMSQGVRRGLDYTPLYRFLISKVGHDWSEVHSEAVSRLDHEDPIWNLVARSEEERRPRVRIGEGTYFSGLYVDADNRLALVDPSLDASAMAPYCGCCTHTFNGRPFGQPFPGHDAS